MTQDFGFLHLDLLFFLNLLNLHSLGDHRLLLNVGLDLISLIGLRLLLLNQLRVGSFFDLKIALCFGLLGLRERLGEHALLIGLGLCDRGLA